MKVKQGIVAHVISPFSRGLHFCRVRRTSNTMDKFCHLYLLLILLMRSGDVETNPGPNTAVSTINEMEFLNLAKAIPPSYYMDVGISLEIPNAQLQAILVENLMNYTNALLDVFMQWNVMQQPPHSNKRQLLADKLREIDLGGLSDRLLNESLIPNSTGGPSRLLESQTKAPSAESQTKPLSPELVYRCANDFKFKYRSTLCRIRADPLNPSSLVGFEKLYANLVLKEEDGTGKQAIDYNNFLDLKVNGEFPKRIMVQGEAGAGKTTFCAKIAWDWIEGRHFSHFVWVLVVPLRESKQHNIGEIAKSYLAKNNPATVSQITEYIRSNPDKVFIAFDGLDEVSGNIMKITSCESQPIDQMQLQPSQPSVTSSETGGSSSETGDIGLVDILCSDQLASCPVLVTTRPWRAVEIRSDGDLMKLYTFIHVQGFNRENLSVYIHKYFPKNDDKANQLIQFTSDNDVISENMAHYPIYVAMLCLMWKELDEQKLKEMKSLKTFSQIFKEMIAFLKEHYAQKKVKKVGSPSLIAYLKQIDELLEPIAKQALNGLLKNTLVFGEDDFEICPESKETACRIGILSQEDRFTANTDTHERNPHVQLPVFFPHKLFQVYMAGVHLASLYESDRNKMNRLIEQVVLPRREEFRYLLYFTVSQNKSIATHVMKSVLREIDMNRGVTVKQIDFIVDVAFESQDPDVAALVKDRISSEEIELTVDTCMTAHTVAGYAFIGPHVVKLHIKRDCGPTMSLDVAEIICSMPSLEEVVLESELHHCFFETLARKGKESKVQTLQLDDVQCPTAASSHHLVEALCSLPNLTDLTLGMVLNEEFYSTFRAKASSIQVQTLELFIDQCPTPASSHHLVEALCFLPNLIDLTLGRILNEEFLSTLKAKASSIQVQTLKLHVVQSPTPASSHHLVEAICSMPNLTDLTLGLDLNEEFYSTLNSKASSIQVQTFQLHVVQCPTPASSHHLVEALCAMPNLTDLALGIELNEEFYSTLNSKASSIQVQTLRLDVFWCPTPPSCQHLAEALCSMPNLTDLTLHGRNLTEEFFSILKAKASFIQGCFPQIRKGNFRFNGVAQDDLNSFLHTLTCSQSLHYLDSSSNSGNSNVTQFPSIPYIPYLPTFMSPGQPLRYSYHCNTCNTRNVSSEQSRAMYQETMASTSRVNPVHTNISVLHSSGSIPLTSYHPQQQLMDDVHYPRRTFPSSDHPQQQPMGDVHYPRRTLPPSYHPKQQPLGDIHYPRRALPPSDHPQQQPMGDVHYPTWTLPPSDHPQQQPMDDVHYPRWTLPPSDHPQQQPMGDVHYPRRTLPPSDYPQQQPMGDVHYPRRTLPSLDHPQQQPIGDIHYPRRTLPSDHPQQQPMGGVHYPRRTVTSSYHPQQKPMDDVHSLRRTLPLLDHPKQHVGKTSDTVCQFSQTHREGSSLSRRCKRKAPSTQSKVPQDDPEIPEKQSKYEV